MHRPCVVMLSPETALLLAAAEALRANGIDVHFLLPCEDAASDVRTLLPDAVIATDALSDADLLRTCRNLRGNVGSQHVASLVMVAAHEQELAAANGSAAQRERRAGEELAAALTQWLRTAEAVRAERDYVAHDCLSIDRRRFSATVDGQEIPLTITEFRLLWTLARGAGQVFSRAELHEACSSHDAGAHQRTIDVHIRAIRKKLGPSGNLVETVRGVGYRLAPPAMIPRVFDRAS